MNEQDVADKRFKAALEIVDSRNAAELLTLARVLYANGYAPTHSCSYAVHIYCTGKRCNCDCHLTNEQYENVHGVPKTP